VFTGEVEGKNTDGRTGPAAAVGEVMESDVPNEVQAVPVKSGVSEFGELYTIDRFKRGRAAFVALKKKYRGGRGRGSDGGFPAFTPAHVATRDVV
jgi:hypothetical protein